MARETPPVPTGKSNIPEYSVSELAFSVKKSLEQGFGRIRVRGELSRVKIHSSGHMYSTLKDDKSNLNIVCWRGNLGKLPVKPEEGLEVICTGRISAYPARSNYQMIVETMELAGEGALLKMLEERRKKLAAEGLFDESRKKSLPFLPDIIGVVTSPSGAVIRDIMHRLNDRFPRRVFLWPVIVQGEGAPDQIVRAIKGFNALNEKSALPRPDVLIVGRGGGALEDLMPFNEESVVRAIADSVIPVISAVGHETDTTLSDFAADKRAPTPTGAAEIAVPRRIDLHARLVENGQRAQSALYRRMDNLSDKLATLEARIGDPARYLETKSQNFDFICERLDRVFDKILQIKRANVAEIAARLPHPRTRLAEFTRQIEEKAGRLHRAGQNIPQSGKDRLNALARMLESLSYHKVLERGYVVVFDKNGTPLTCADQTNHNQEATLTFKDERKITALLNPGAGSPKRKNPAKKGHKGKDSQKSLF